MNISDTVTWMELKGIRTTGYDPYTDYQSMAGIQNHLEIKVMDTQVTHLGTASIHNLDTRQRNNLYLPQANLAIYQKGTYYLGIKFFNNLPLEMKNVAGKQKKKKFKLL